MTWLKNQLRDKFLAGALAAVPVVVVVWHCRGEFASKRFLIRSSRPTRASREPQPASVRHAEAGYFGRWDRNAPAYSLHDTASRLRSAY
jgi:hypothetical protein